MLSDFLGASGHRTLRLSEINEHSVGVDAHIDPRAAEKLLGPFLAKLTEGVEFNQTKTPLQGRQGKFAESENKTADLTAVLLSNCQNPDRKY